MFTFILNWLKKRRVAWSSVHVPEKNTSHGFQIQKQVHLHWHVSDSSQIPQNVIWNAGQLVTPNVATVDTTARIYDKELLERVRMQWQFGEWETLSEIDVLTVEQHPDRAKIALVVASAWLQLGDSIQARKFTQHAKEWGCDKKLIAQLLIAGVHNTLGRVASLNGDEVRAMTHFRDAVKGVSGDSKLASQVRLAKEFARLVESSDRSSFKIRSDKNLNIPVRNIKKILITGDVLRTGGDGKLAQESNINWLYALIGTQILSILAQNGHPESNLNIFSGDVEISRSIYSILNLDFTEDGWSKIYNSQFPNSVQNILSEAFHLEPNTIIIGFELSPAIKGFLLEKGITYIDIRIGQYRYLDDLLLNFSTNNNEINVKLKRYEVSRYTFNSAANIERYKRRYASIDIEPHSLIFFGQSRADASLIDLDDFDSYKNYLDEIIATASNYEVCYYKPHPYARDQDAISFFENIGFKITDSNVYDLLSSSELELVMGLNSSVLYEAHFFGKQVIKLRCVDIYESSYPIQQNSFLSSDFWADILNQVKPVSSFQVQSRPNQLRESLGCYWGKVN